MAKQKGLSNQTRNNWLIDALVFSSAVAAFLSGIYFLYFPVGGFQGGRNPSYGVEILFGRATWDSLHTWGGIIMITAVVVHFTIHWPWVVMMAKRVVNSILSRGTHMSRGAKINLAINLVIGMSFLLVAISGIYFLFVSAGGYQGGRNTAWDPGFIFSRSTWDLIHTWSGVFMILAAVAHFVIHWRWVKKVTGNVLGSLGRRRVFRNAPQVS